jgi:hypothetical protein
MAIVMTVITLMVRLVNPHSFFGPLVGKPLVPALTGLMGLSAGVDALRRRVSLKPPLYIVLQWGMLFWCFVTVFINGYGFGNITETMKLLNDTFFCTVAALVVDRISRFKLFMCGFLAALTFVAVFGVPQIWSPRLCAEVIGPNYDDVIWDTRACSSNAFCDESPPARDGAPAARKFRCERRGPFDISTLLGRMRWVAVFDDPNTLSSMCATFAPLLVAWLWCFKKRKWLKRMVAAGVFVALTAITLATGSRGSLMGLLLGVFFVLWSFLGKKLIIIGGILIVAVGAPILISGKKVLHRGDETELTGTSESDKWRTKAMDVGFKVWGQYPVFGVGHSQIFKHHVLEAHNGYISAASEIGTPGLLLMVLILWMNFRFMIAARLHAIRHGLDEYRRLATGAIGGLIGGTLSYTVFLTNYASFATYVLSLLSGTLHRSLQQADPTYSVKLSYWDLVGAAITTALIMGATYFLLMFYFSSSGFPFEFDTSKGVLPGMER